jgi:hypothetical protein
MYFGSALFCPSVSNYFMSVCGTDPLCLFWDKNRIRSARRQEVIEKRFINGLCSKAQKIMKEGH